MVMDNRENLTNLFDEVFNDVYSKFKLEPILKKQFEDIGVANSYLGKSYDEEKKFLIALIEATAIRERSVFRELLIRLKLRGFFD